MTDTTATSTAIWEGRVRARLAPVAVARIVAQALAFAWFVFATRSLPRDEFGLVATGLIWTTLFMFVGNAGAAWTINRYVAADTSLARSAFVKGTAVRVASGVVCGVLALIVDALVIDDVPPRIVVLAAGTAIAAGVTEVGNATLRAIGRLRTETITLVVERTLFLAVALALLSRGTSATMLLGAYLVTNAATAAATAAVILRTCPVGLPAGPFWDREARRLAGAYAAIGLVPQVTGVLVVLLATPDVVATYAVAARPVEGAATLLVALVIPLVSPMRAFAAARRPHAVARAVAVAATAVAAVLGPLIAWFATTPEQAIQLLAPDDRLGPAASVLAVLCWVALTWPLRVVAQLAFVASDASHRVLRIAGIGLGVNVALGVPLILAGGARGGAIAFLTSEIVMLAATTLVAPDVVAHLPKRMVTAVGLTSLASAATALALADQAAIVSCAAAAVWVALGAMLGVRALRGLDRLADAHA